MTKYLAVIKDSFREALASRVLWLVLVLITLFLTLIAPLGYEEVLTWSLGDGDVFPWEQFMDQLRDEGKLGKKTPAKRVFSLLDEELRDRLAEVKIPGIDRDTANPMPYLQALGGLQKGVNNVLEQRDFYAEAFFEDVPMISDELRALRDKGLENLSEIEVKRFNRLLLEASFPDIVRSSPPTSIQFKYAWTKPISPIPLRGDDLRDQLQDNGSWVMSWFVGGIGILVAILVTSSVVPQMFDPGSLHLLLSKPVSRWMLFLSKFFGGCAFICICAAYLVTGLWLILGTRFGVWDPTFLIGIPVYVFVFAIYYAVSSLAGVVYRSPIVCIAVTIVFWLACVFVGWVKGVVERIVWEPARFVRVLEAGDDLLAVNEFGVTHRWDDESRKWQETFSSREQQQGRIFMASAAFFGGSIPTEMRPMGPVHDANNDQLIAVHPAFPPPGNPKLYAADRGEDWEPESHNNAPSGTRALFQEPSGDVLIASSVGIHRLTGDPLEEKKPVELFGFALPLPTAGPLENVGPRNEDAIVLTNPASAAMNASNGQLALYTRGWITLLKPNTEQEYEKLSDHRLDGKEREPVVLAVGGSSIVLGRRDGRVQVLDASNFQERLSSTPEKSTQARFITASPDGRWFAIALHSGNLWVYDANTNELTKARVAGQGDISCAMFLKDNKLYVADRAIRLTKYALPDFSREQRYSPSFSTGLIAYRYVILPIYTIFPKPGELDTTFEYFLSGKKTDDNSSENDLAAAQRKTSPWTPVWSSALFMIVVLGLSCVYIEWQEF